MSAVKDLPSSDPSPYVEDVDENIAQTNVGDTVGWYSYVVSFIVVTVLLLILYYSWCQFYENQEGDSFIEKPVNTGTESDESFDIDNEVKRLSDLQEKYLRKLNAKRNF